MDKSGGYLLSAAVFLGVAFMILLGAEQPQWWTVMTVAAAFAASAVFALRAALEWRRSRRRQAVETEG